MGELVVAVDDPQADDVRAVLERHLAFAHEVTPLEGVHALGIDALREPLVSLYSGRVDGEVVGVVALAELDSTHGEVKSLHTVAAARGRGVGRALVDHVIGVAGDRGYRRLSLETGDMEAFAPARALYARAGFRPCAPYGRYAASPTSACMTLALGPPTP